MTTYRAINGRVIRQCGDAVEDMDPTEALRQASEMRAAALLAEVQEQIRAELPIGNITLHGRITGIWP